VLPPFAVAPKATLTSFWSVILGRATSFSGEDDTTMGPALGLMVGLNDWACAVPTNEHAMSTPAPAARTMVAAERFGQNFFTGAVYRSRTSPARAERACDRYGALPESRASVRGRRRRETAGEVRTIRLEQREQLTRRVPQRTVM
jgi:hypothetical protein